MTVGLISKAADDQHPSGAALDNRPEEADPPQRKRTRRACDKCSASRTRCDGTCPCRRCQEYGYSCRYNRQVRKRGRLPKARSNDAAKADSDRPHLQSDERPIRVLASISPQAPASPPEVTSRSARNSFPSTLNGSPGDTLNLGPILSGRDRRDSVALKEPIQQRPFPAPLSVTSLIQPDLQPHSGLAGSPPATSPLTNTLAPMAVPGLGFRDSEVAMSDESASYTSPADAQIYDMGRQHGRRPILSLARNDRDRNSFSTTATTGQDGCPNEFLHKAPNNECCYPFLNPVLPYLHKIIPASAACDLLDIFLTDPGSSLFRSASPYILTRIFRKKSIVSRSNPRPTTPALLATILWCVSQTADIMMLHVPGSRAKIVNDLYDLATSLISERDPDRWRRVHGGLRAENEMANLNLPNTGTIPMTTPTNEPSGATDDVLTFILLSIAVSGGDFKSDAHKWWSKAVRLSISLRLHREDETCSASVSPCANPLCSCKRNQQDTSLEVMEHREERRRLLWLLYSLDRHLALSFNSTLSLPDHYCEVYAPLPEFIWENLDVIPAQELPTRKMGPPTVITGTGFLDFFLPLMVILGDIIEVHHRKEHPRLGGEEDHQSIAIIQELLANCELSLQQLSDNASPFLEMPYLCQSRMGGDVLNVGSGTGYCQSATSPQDSFRAPDQSSKIHLVKAYSMHILHVLHVLLHGKWDAISMLDDGSDWITSKRFNECASHAITASQSVWTILNIDPELTFMSYLFGIYLLHGSFILLLFADRMPQLGPNESVEQACENIIRAHEVCVVTLSTEFQKNFRKVLRSTLYSVRGSGTTDWEEHRARRRALSLYRWTPGAKGLAL